MSNENEDGGGEGSVGMKDLLNEMKTLHTSLKRELRDTREGLSSEIRSTNLRIDTTNERIERVADDMRVDLNAVHKRTIESELRLSTAVIELTDTVKSLRETIVGWRAEHREDRELLRKRLDSIESRLPQH